MDFREREVDFQEADRRYAELVRQRDAGEISNDEFDIQRQQLVVEDDEGRLWTKSNESGEWRYHDGKTWVKGSPPGYEEYHSVAESDGSTRQTQSTTYPEVVERKEDKRRRMPRWIPAAGFGGTLLLGIVLVVWVLVPYLWDGSASLLQGGAGPDEDLVSAVFVHQATPDNISANSTYLDNPLINEDPNAILYVTQNWNPGGGTGTYNDHPVGVWYDDSRQRWAIFNQDREAMPEAAAFNVAVLRGATESR